MKTSLTGCACECDKYYLSIPNTLPQPLPTYFTFQELKTNIASLDTAIPALKKGMSFIQGEFFVIFERFSCYFCVLVVVGGMAIF